MADKIHLHHMNIHTFLHCTLGGFSEDFHVSEKLIPDEIITRIIKFRAAGLQWSIIEERLDYKYNINSLKVIFCKRKLSKRANKKWSAQEKQKLKELCADPALRPCDISHMLEGRNPSTVMTHLYGWGFRGKPRPRST